MILKILNLKIVLTIDMTMSVVGVLTFSSLISMFVEQLKILTMMKKIICVVVGVALVGRMVSNSALQDVAIVVNVI